jgi:hypothetical protein
MEQPTRRSVLIGGAGLIGGAAATFAVLQADGDTESARASTAGEPRAAAKPNEYIWAINPNGVVVPSDTWTKIPWPKLLLNTSPARLDDDGATWVFPVATTAGIHAILCNIAWDNARSPDGAPIAPRTHRKLARIPQQDTGDPQIDQPINLGSATDLTYHADLALLGDQETLSDGSKGFQQQQVYIQTGISPHVPDQRTWVEVYQNSGQPLVCRWDGSSAPKTADQPQIIGLQAPSLMVAKLCDF